MAPCRYSDTFFLPGTRKKENARYETGNNYYKKTAVMLFETKCRTKVHGHIKGSMNVCTVE